MPWKNVVFAHALPVLFTVSPASNGNWMVDTMPPEPGSFEQRLPLPADWAGLEAAALAERSGVADAVFVHLRRFVGAAKSREGAVAMVWLGRRGAAWRGWRHGHHQQVTPGPGKGMRRPPLPMARNRPGQPLPEAG
jgi:hypothetical protein